MDRRYGLPGDYLTRGNPYTRMLLRNAGRANNGTDAGGLASALSQGLMGYMYGQDRNAAREDRAAQAAAQQALVSGMMPTEGTPQGGHPGLMDVPAQPGSPGGYAGAVGALQGLEGNQYAGRLAADLMMKQIEARQQAEATQAAFDRQKELKASPGWAAPKPPVPGRDVPYPDEVASQLTSIAGAKAAAMQQPATGYEPTADGGLAPIPGGPQDPATIAAQEEARATAKANVPQVVKPMPATAVKMQDDQLEAIQTAESIATDLGSLREQINKGEIDLGVAANAINQGLNYFGQSTPESRKYGSFTTTLEKLRNDSLRLNNGIQTEGDAQRAWKELFASLNDNKLVADRLAEIEQINKRAVDMRKFRVDSMRREFQQPDFNWSEMGGEKKVIGAGDAVPQIASDADYDALPSGTKFIDPEGKTRIKP